MESTKDCEMLDQNTDPQFVMEQVKSMHIPPSMVFGANGRWTRGA